MQLRKPNAYTWLRALLLSKLANILFVLELRKRLAGTGVVAVALNPGGVDSPGFRSNVSALIRLLMWPILRVPFSFLNPIPHLVIKIPYAHRSYS